MKLKLYPLLCLAMAAGSFAPANAAAQTALDTANVVVPREYMTPSTDITVIKVAEAGGYAIIVTNTGPESVTRAAITDMVGNGRACLPSAAVSVKGTGVPAGSYKISDLTGAGIALENFLSGQSATLSYSCQGK